MEVEPGGGGAWWRWSLVEPGEGGAWWRWSLVRVEPGEGGAWWRWSLVRVGSFRKCFDLCLGVRWVWLRLI